MFLLIGIIFLLNGNATLLEKNWISFIVLAVAIIAIIYAIASSIAIERQKSSPVIEDETVPSYNESYK